MIKRRVAWVLAVVVGISVAAIAVAVSNSDPSETIDSGTVIGELQSEAKLVSSSRTQRAKVRIKEVCRLGGGPLHATMPNWVCGKDAKFEIDGNVTFSIDLGSVSKRDVEVDPDGAVTLHLSQPTPDEPTIRSIDPLSSDTGIVNKLQGLLRDNKELYNEVVQQAKKQMTATATKDHEAIDKAEDEARKTLTNLLKASGATSVNLEFDRPPKS